MATIMFQSVNQGKISDKIIQQVRELVLSGKLKPGTQLPSEKELMTQFGVSRYTLREALRSLETMGLIEIRKGAGGGAVVKEVTMGVTTQAIANFLHFKEPSIQDLTEVRKIIEPYLARKMAENITENDLLYLQSLNDECRAILNRGEEIIGGIYEIDFHIHMARKAENPVLTMILDFVNNLLVELKLKVKPGSVFSYRVVEAHENILIALRSKDGDLAAKAMYDHVVDVEEEILHIEKLEHSKTA